MKLAITGKGGVGKTTLASLLVKVYAAGGRTVLAIDANPDANLAMALGIPGTECSHIKPIAELNELIKERTGAPAGSYGKQFKLNPRVDDIPEKFAIHIDNIKLLVLGTVDKGGGGCFCPESAVLRSLMANLLLRRSEVVILDMDAGLEHLGRATADGVDAFIIVVEPGLRSIQTAQSIKKLAKDIGITKCYIVGSKTHDESERQFIKDNLPEFDVLGYINFSPLIAEADRKGKGVYDFAPIAAEDARQIKIRLDLMKTAKKVN